MTQIELQAYNAIIRISKEMERLNNNLEKFLEYANRNDKVDN